MKKSFLVLLASLFCLVFFFSCNNPGPKGGNTGGTTTQDPDTVVTPPPPPPAPIPDTNGEVVQLDVESFKKYVWDYTENPENLVYKGDKPALVDINATWCGPCKMIAPFIKDLAKTYAHKSYVYSVDIDEISESGDNNREIFRACGLLFDFDGIPAFILIPGNADPAFSLVGVSDKNKDTIKAFFEKYCK